MRRCQAKFRRDERIGDSVKNSLFLTAVAVVVALTASLSAQAAPSPAKKKPAPVKPVKNGEASQPTGGGTPGGGGGSGGDSGGGGGIARWQIIDCWSMRRVADEPSSIHES